jgi:hypothetical protein
MFEPAPAILGISRFLALAASSHGVAARTNGRLCCNWPHPQEEQLKSCSYSICTALLPSPPLILTTLPQKRPDKVAKPDVDASWSHDMFESHNSLSARLGVQSASPKPNMSMIAQKALRDATASAEPLSIKGASSQANVVEVTGLVLGTTADDVVTIFKRCGPITSAKQVPGTQVKIRLTFKLASDAIKAVEKFDKQQADGKLLSVRIIGSSSAGATLGGRLGGADGLGVVRQEGSVDILMDGGNDTGS